MYATHGLLVPQCVLIVLTVSLDLVWLIPIHELKVTVRVERHSSVDAVRASRVRATPYMIVTPMGLSTNAIHGISDSEHCQKVWRDTL